MVSERWVFVTGASSGVGRSTEVLLSQNGFKVLASVRKKTDSLELLSQNPEYIPPVFIELRDQNTIKHAAQITEYKTGNVGLYGLVNFAAMQHSGPLEYLPRNLWFEQYDVN